MSEHPLRELLDVVSSGLQRFGNGITSVGAKIGDIFHSLGEQLRRNMCAAVRRSYGCSAGPLPGLGPRICICLGFAWVEGRQCVSSSARMRVTRCSHNVMVLLLCRASGSGVCACVTHALNADAMLTVACNNQVRSLSLTETQ